MNDKITLPKLSSMLATASGRQKKLCEDFIRELFRIVAEELENGENVRIKGFGTFKRVEVDSRKSVDVSSGDDVEIPSHFKVVFVPSKEVAAAVNAPFAMFSAEELADNLPTAAVTGDYSGDEYDITPELINDSIEEEAEDEATADAYEELSETAEEEISDKEVPLEADFEEVKPEVTESETQKSAPTESIEESADETVEETDEEYVGFDEYEDEHPHKFRFVYGFLCGILATAVIAFATLYFCGWNPIEFFKSGDSVGSPEATASIDIENVDDAYTEIGESAVIPVDSSKTDSVRQAEDSVKQPEVPTKPSDIPVVYDTVTTTRYLTSIAREHYGNFNLWPIIYEENKEILSHPDRIRPGTKVVVPPLSKYGIDPKNAADVKKVKQKGVEIYSRYK